jgi:hypothetical protein
MPVLWIEVRRGLRSAKYQSKYMVAVLSGLKSEED